jgi:hypothetical protein
MVLFHFVIHQSMSFCMNWIVIMGDTHASAL